MFGSKTKGYAIHGIAGALLLPVLYYYSLQKNSLMCALIPTIPILGIYGLYCTIDNKGNLDKYLKNIIIFGIMYVGFFSLMYYIYDITNNILLASAISMIVWTLITLLYVIYYNP